MLLLFVHIVLKFAINHINLVLCAPRVILRYIYNIIIFMHTRAISVFVVFFFRPSTFSLGTNRVFKDMITLRQRHFRMHAYDKQSKNSIDACAAATMDNSNNDNSNSK